MEWSRREPLRQAKDNGYTAPFKRLTKADYQNAGKTVKLNLIYPHCPLWCRLPPSRILTRGGGWMPGP